MKRILTVGLLVALTVCSVCATYLQITQPPLDHIIGSSDVNPAPRIPTGEDVAGWPMYENSQLGVQFRYPDTWRVGSTIDPTGVNVTKRDGSAQMTLKDGAFDQGISPCIRLVNTRSIKVGGLPAIRQTWAYPSISLKPRYVDCGLNGVELGRIAQVELLIHHGSAVIVVSFYPSMVDNLHDVEIFDTIVATLSFN